MRYLIGTLAFVLTAVTPAAAQTCTPLAVVAGDGTSVTKRVSPPNAGTIPKVPVGFRGNWDTDFAVPGGMRFNQYVATIQSESTEDANFKVKMFLKYSDGTADRIFDDNVSLTPGESREITGRPRENDGPFQVNLNVGGVDALGQSYTLSVLGCE